MGPSPSWRFIRDTSRFSAASFSRPSSPASRCTSFSSCWLRVPAWISALTAMLTAAVLAAVVWGMPAGLVASASTEGMAFGLWPISWIVLNAVFFHNLTIASGDFEVIKRSLTRLTEDRRIQALLVAFCFGALMEGIAGFGAPVAISAAILASLGFEPISAAVATGAPNPAMP